jgi:hypothetical protein
MRLTLWERQYRDKAPRCLGTFETPSPEALLASYAAGQRVQVRPTAEAAVFHVETPSRTVASVLFVAPG